MADDHELFRDGFAGMFRQPSLIELMDQASNGKYLLAQVERHRPDVVLTDIQMPEMDGIQAARIIHERFPSIGIIGLSMSDKQEDILKILDAGAVGYLSKNARKEEVISAVKQVSRGGAYYCNSTSMQMSKLIAAGKFIINREKETPLFNETEMTIILLICREYFTKEIADKLAMSVRTVENYRRRIMVKMGVRTAVGIIMYAIRFRILSL